MRQVRRAIAERLCASLQVDAGTLDPDKPFADYGLDSIMALQTSKAVGAVLGIPLQTSDLFDHPTLNKLASHVLSAHRAAVSVRFGRRSADGNLDRGSESDSDRRSAPEDGVSPPLAVRRASAYGRSLSAPRESAALQSARGRGDPVAIVGLGARFPHSETAEQLWEHLASGRDLTEEVSRWDRSQFADGGSAMCPRGGFLADIDRFDPTFFNISGLEATYMDPQQRLFMEVAWEALEDGGYAGLAIEGRRCGVYVGCAVGDYSRLFGRDVPAQAFWGNAGSIVPARMSYALNLQGPAVAVDTACSSSLVATYLACQALWGGEVELALAGGVTVHCTPQFYVASGNAGMLSRTGRCSTFDERADGFVPGEGVGVILLKRLRDALSDGDHIHAVIRGAGINQDGTTNGITAPSGVSQERLECEVYDTFAIDPADIQLVEAHGTGTKLGDPIEFRALTQSFRRGTPRRNYCAIGSIKTNIGHALSAAGIAGVIKILLALRYKQIPPSLHFEKANPHIDLESSPFFVNTRLRAWEVADGKKRRAVVSSFSFSGTNAHMVIEEAPLAEQRHAEQPAYLIVLSARSSAQLQEQAKRLVRYVGLHTAVDCGNLSYTLLLGRKHFNHRLACVARDAAELAATLEQWLQNGRAERVFASAAGVADGEAGSVLRGYLEQCMEQCHAGAQDGGHIERLSAIASGYVNGEVLDFRRLFPAGQYSRLSLPTYPFARERYWVQGERQEAPGVAVLHPLLQENASQLDE
ncbi:MAG: beta-ketoacyl synthase N-terminal-like domain-containing protein, partial [Steroidobacteraceae bacterium]